MSIASIQLYKTKEFQESIKKKYDKLDNKEAFHKKVIVELDKWKDRNFQQEGKLATSGGWTPLKEGTIAMRREGSSKILQDNGDLKNKWKTFWSYKQGFIRSGLPYAKAHHLGMKIKHPGGTKYTFKKNKETGKSEIVWLKKNAAKFIGITKAHDIKLPERRILPTKEQLLPIVKKILQHEIRSAIK